MKNKTILDAFLLDCQCALFLLDITDNNRFNFVKEIITIFNTNKYPLLTKIIVDNKTDIIRNKDNDNLIENINVYLKKFNIDYISISIKTGDNFDYLLNKIYNIINQKSLKTDILPINQVEKYIFTDKSYQDYKGAVDLILVGNSGVGKTSFMTRYINNKFNLINTATTGINNTIKQLKINNNYYKLILWDTAGQERYGRLPRKYYRNADGVLLFFDINDKKSFEEVSDWIKEINEYCIKIEEGEEIEKKVIIYLIGNKIDLFDEKKEKIIKEEIEEFVNQTKIKYYEISCKWNLNIEEVMARIILDCYKAIKSTNEPKGNFELTGDGKPIKKEQCCSNQMGK